MRMKFHENTKNSVLMKLQVMSTILANMLGSKNFRCLVGDEVAAAGQPTYDLERQPAWCDRVLHSKVSVQRKSCSAAGATLMVLKNWGRAFSVGEIVLQKHFFSGGTMRYPKICN